MDPNWFYSTLAQSTAAIVGLAGAFLLQRLFAQREAIAAPRARLRELMRQRFARVATTREQVETILRELSDMEHVVSKARDRGVPPADQPWTVTVMIQQEGQGRQVGARSRTLDALPDLASVGNKLRSFQARTPGSMEQFIRALEEGGMKAGDAEWLASLGPPEPAAADSYDYWDAITAQPAIAAQRWQVFHRASEEWAGELQGFRSSLIPQSFWALLAILGGLLLVGLIAPLFYLTARSGLSRPILLALFIPLALGFLGYAFYELRRLRDAGDLAKDSF